MEMKGKLNKEGNKSKRKKTQNYETKSKDKITK